MASHNSVHPPDAAAGGTTFRDRRAVRARLAAVLTLLAALTLVAGCGLRLQTPRPTEPTPGAVEQARAHTTASSVALRAAADQASTTADPAAAAVLEATAADAARHVEQLGGIYSSGLSTPTPTVTSSPATAPPQSPQTVLTLLTVAAEHSLADAAATSDAHLSRLLASVTVSRLQDARRLAAASALAAPPVADAKVPVALPAGVTPAQITETVLAEDEAGFAFEVIAAKLADQPRTVALARADLHRLRAQQWAALATSVSDPRRVAYALPGDLDTPARSVALAATLETALASSYAALVADVAANAPSTDRRTLIAFTDDAWAAALTWGAVPVALPALPEQQRAG
jgi:hypothetical protein